MSEDIFVLVEHHAGVLGDANVGLLATARSLAAGTGGRAVACLLGHGARELAAMLHADAVLYADDPALADFVPEAYVAAMTAIVTAREPRLVLIANTTVGLDVAAPLAVRTGRPLVASCVQLAVDGGLVVATSQLYGGKLRAEVEVSGPAIVSVVSGLGSGSAAAAAAEATEADGEAADGEAADARGVPEPEDVRSPDLSAVHTRFVARREPEPGDVDITREEILVSVGRGIGGAENVELAQELADALGGALSGSRPVIDAGWLAKSRQVGKSGARVRPKLYLACGISGAPEHLEGIAGAELVIAINTDPNAPIFEVADYGATEDLFDVLPALVEALDAAAL